MTTDFRSVFGEVITGHLGATTTERIFPKFEGGATLGVV